MPHFYLKKSKRADRFICRGTGRKPVQMHQCRHGTRPHWAHHHNQPGYPHKTPTHKETASRLPQSVFVVTPPRGGDSDINRSFPDRAEVAAERLRRHTSPRRRFRHHPQLPKHSLTDGIGPHAGLCQQLATRAKDRHLRIRRRASKGKYAGLAPTENKPIGHVGKTDYRSPAATQLQLDASSLPNCTLGPSRAARPQALLTEPQL